MLSTAEPPDKLFYGLLSQTFDLLTFHRPIYLRSRRKKLGKMGLGMGRFRFRKSSSLGVPVRDEASFLF